MLIERPAARGAPCGAPGCEHLPRAAAVAAAAHWGATQP